ncbi:Lreu_0056 family protein [Companilactobacillus baiquanensis]|uniref:DUF4767 domain-containing protein n=1 Tax=Companilactobacillus baiquanensis TaxID=2486005 RepID=A0ABW1UUL4_9LACO|nr:DUF4767 domain-containing protein [Companilactobacillus baiquanensis]
MKVNKLKLTMILFSALILTGCTSEKPNVSKNSSQNTTKVSKKSSDKSTNSDKKTDTLWNNSKDKQLESFINQWAPTMKQNYTKYNGSRSLKTSTGTVYPDDLSNVTVLGSSSSIGFSKDGEGKYAYNVVAIYNYNGTVPPLPNHITYFFAFHDGQPIVLVDQSRDGTPDLSETQNNDVRSAFSNIVAGKSVNTSSNNQSSGQSSSKKSSTSLTHDPIMIGLMLRDMRGWDDVEMEPNLAVYEDDGMYRISTGTLASETPYRINGDTVTYYTKDFSNGDSDAEAPLIPHDMSLKELEDKYYSTDSQRQNIQSIASQMPDING